MAILTFWPIIVSLAGLAVLAFGALFFAIVRPIRKLEGKAMIMLKATDQSIHVFRALGKKIDHVASENQKMFNYHNKAFNHQNVLISSLNRQIKNLDAMLSDGGIIEGQSNASPTLGGPGSSATLPGPRMLREPQTKSSDSRAISTGTHSNPRNSTVLLNQLLLEKRARLVNHPGGSGKIAKLSTIFRQERTDNPNVSNLGEQSVSHG